jgi:hypothetical protein
MHVAHPSADLLVPAEWPVSLLVLLQAVLGEVGEGGWWRFFVLVEVRDALLNQERRRVGGQLVLPS